MFAAKLQGHLDLRGFGRLSWPEFVVLVDVLLAGLFKSTTVRELTRVLDVYESSHESSPTLHEPRHFSLHFLAWLLEGWPHGVGPQVSQELLRRWLGSEHDFASAHLPADWAGKGGEETYSVGSDIRLRIEQLHASLLVANSGVHDAERPLGHQQ